MKLSWMRKDCQLEGKDVSKLLLIGYTVITQNRFESKSVTKLSFARITDFDIEKLPWNSIFFCVRTVWNINSNLLTSLLWFVF